MSKFARLSIDGIEPVDDGPAPENILSGAPRCRYWNVEEADGGISSGVWEATPGKWRFRNDHWEYCRVLSGVSIITEDGGTPQRVSAGDSFFLRAGVEGTWEVLETTRKEYVIRS